MSINHRINISKSPGEADRESLMERMLESPESLSDSEISMILEDDELRDIYTLSVDVRDALRQPVAIDADKEWQLLRPRLGHKKRRPLLWIARVAAILIGLLLVSAVIIALSDRQLPETEPLMAGIDDGTVDESVEIPVQQIATLPDTISPTTPTPSAPQTPRSVAKKPMLAKADKPAETTPTEPDLAEDIDIDEYLRVMQARIDNEMAMMQAEALLNQYYAATNGEANAPRVISAALTMGDGNTDNNFLTLIMQ